MPAPVRAPNPLVIYIGDTLSFNVTMRDLVGAPIAITGRTYRMQVRESAGSSTAITSASCTVTSASGGVVNVAMSSASTGALTPTNGVADLEEFDAGAVTSLIRWQISIVQDVTR